MPFSVSVVEYPRVFLAGMRVETDIFKAAEDCPRLWHGTFMPRVHELSLSGSGETYGISLSTNPSSGQFEYWAAAPVHPEAELPEGFERITIQPAMYAKCAVASMGQITEAYRYIYTGWSENNEEYSLDLLGSCFELYPAHWTPDQPFDIYAQLKRN